MRSPLQVFRDWREQRRLDQALLQTTSHNYERDPWYYRSGVDFMTNRPKYRMHKDCPTATDYRALFWEFYNEVCAKLEELRIPEPAWNCLGAPTYDPYAEKRYEVAIKVLEGNPQYASVARELGFDVDKTLTGQ